MRVPGTDTDTDNGRRLIVRSLVARDRGIHLTPCRRDLWSAAVSGSQWDQSLLSLWLRGTPQKSL